MIQAVDFPVGYGINAVGKMKLPNITSSIVYLTIVPISYVAMKLGANPTIAYLVSVCAFPGALLFDVWILTKYIGFQYQRYIKEVVVKTSLFIIICSIPPLLIHMNMETGFIRLLIVTSISIGLSVPLIYYKGLEPNVRQIVTNKAKTMIPFCQHQ
jgi:hypothetical protein